MSFPWCLFSSIARLQVWLCITFIWVWAPCLGLFTKYSLGVYSHNSAYMEKLKHRIGYTEKSSGSTQILWIPRWGHGACDCHDTHSSHHPLGSLSWWNLLSFLFHGSHLFVFVFHLWMDKLFLHVPCILKQIFNYAFSTVLMWTYEQLRKVQIKAPHFQLFVTIFAFCETFWGCGLPHPLL